MKRNPSTIASATIGALLCAGAIFAAGLTQPAQPQARGGPDAVDAVGETLIRGLQDTEGCLKVITADTSEGTNTIIAWFENKAAVERWYHSPTHTRFVRMVGSDPNEKKPMAHVKDEN
ncbi:MAG: antibiotic biosynthesis monooxygenase, partial [bacterium]|nr:antibiotic biosynthesis monooxygenase [bacterium]